jgi:plastocyanin
MRNGLILVVVLGLAVAIGVLRAHASPASVAAPTPAAAPLPTAAPPPDTIYMVGGSNGNANFVPARVTIRVGQKLTFVDRDIVDHSATASDGSFDTGVLGPGETKTITFHRTGVFDYSDILQSNMSGQVTVKP